MVMVGTRSWDAGRGRWSSANQAGDRKKTCCRTPDAAAKNEDGRDHRLERSHAREGSGRAVVGWFVVGHKKGCLGCRAVTRSDSML